MKMTSWTPITVAIIGAVTAISGSLFATSANVDAKINTVNTELQVTKTTQSLQYTEIKGNLERIEKKLDTVLK